ncbi:MAG: TIGR02452 family protein [Candidatus Competibacterales bacterium]
MSLKRIAQETLTITQDGAFTAPSGKVVHFAPAQRRAEDATVLYRPDELPGLLAAQPPDGGGFPTVEVTDETTQAAAHRLVVWEGCRDLVLLNFASARNPGGGFLNGAKAQEEDLARCSGLYLCQLKQPDYYAANRAEPSLLYTDHIIYSPRVPWFRIDHRSLLEDYFPASVITAPAPNAGQVLGRDPTAQPEIGRTLRRRAGYVLAVARDNGHRTLLLGAWGCGVFRNDPAVVADAFGQWLQSPTFRGCFHRVVFGVYDSSPGQGTLKAFQKPWQPPTPPQNGA